MRRLRHWWSFKDYKISPLPLKYLPPLPASSQTVSPESPTVELLDFPRDLSGRLQTLRPNNNGYHSSRRCYRGGWHRSCPALAMQCFLGITTARFVTWHSRFPYRCFQHCKVFAPAAPRRAWIRVSESISGLLLSQPVPVVG